MQAVQVDTISFGRAATRRITRTDYGVRTEELDLALAFSPDDRQYHRIQETQNDQAQ